MAAGQDFATRAIFTDLMIACNLAQAGRISKWYFYDSVVGTEPTQEIVVPGVYDLAACNVWRGNYIHYKVLIAIKRVADKLKAAQDLYNVLNMTGTFAFTPDAGVAQNDYHKVTITNADTTNLTWTNAAGVKWSLTRRKDLLDPYGVDRLGVRMECPYYGDPYVFARLIYHPDNAGGPRYGEVTGIVGPANQIYVRVP